MGVKMGWIQIKMGHPLARNGAALAPFRANGAHPSGTEVCRLVVTNLRREFAHARNFQFKIPTKSCACAIFRRKFVTTNLQTSVVKRC